MLSQFQDRTRTDETKTTIIAADSWKNKRTSGDSPNAL